VIEIGQERFLCAEALFDPEVYLGRQDAILNGIHSMVTETIRSLPIDLKRDMYDNIILSGGTTLLPGLAERIKAEVKRLVPPTVEVTVSSKGCKPGRTTTMAFGLPMRYPFERQDPCSLLDASGSHPPQVHAPVNRHLAVWAGGSVLASTQHFNGHWISRDEFEAYGSDLLHATR
jgi:actin-related protein